MASAIFYDRPPSAPPPPPALSPEELKAQRAAEYAAQKASKSGESKIAKLEANLEEAETALAALDAEMVNAGSDVGRLAELSDEQKQAEEQKKEAACHPPPHYL